MAIEQPRNPGKLGAAAQWALGELQAALTAQGWRITATAPPLLTLAWQPGPAESFTLTPAADGALHVTAADDTGLCYALTDLAQRIASPRDGATPFHAVSPTQAAPTLAWRSAQVFVGHALLDAPWYFNDDYWQWYLGLLARCRFNNLSLTFCHQTSYLAPPYPFLVPLPEFPQVRTPGFTVDQRNQHLTQLQRISSLARQRGLHFTLGIWQQHDNGFGQPMLTGLDEDIRADCNALGLRRLLEACPAIDGLQFRMNYEAGIPEHQQTEFWEKQFDAIVGVARPIRVDLRAKGLSDETIAQAQRRLSDVVVSTKHWCEHLGLPYPMPAIQSFDVPHYRRYGTWDLLRKPQAAPLIMRLWNFGTQRLLQWGDRQYVRRFVRGCADFAAGFEVMAPLTNKGSSNQPMEQPWRIIADRAVQPFEWEQQRYERFYQLFGRLGYDVEHGDAALRTWMEQAFGPAGAALDEAFDAAGIILPLLTTLLQYSASAWGFWPELFAGRSLIEDARIEPSDPTQFYGVTEYVTAALGEQLDGRWSPYQSAQHLHELARATRSALERIVDPTPAARGALLDLHIQADLAQFHAHRLSAMTDWQLFECTRAAAALEQAIEQMRQALTCWRALAARTVGVYHDQLTFGRAEFKHIGHWRDRLPQVEAELAELTRRRAMLPLAEVPLRALPGRTLPPELGTVEAALPAVARAGQPLRISLHFPDQPPIAHVTCLHKPALQTLPFQPTPMQRDGVRFSVTLPGACVPAQWNLQVMFVVHHANGSVQRWPDWRCAAPGLTITTGAAAP